MICSCLNRSHNGDCGAGLLAKRDASGKRIRRQDSKGLEPLSGHLRVDARRPHQGMQGTADITCLYHNGLSFLLLLASCPQPQTMRRNRVALTLRSTGDLGSPIYLTDPAKVWPRDQGECSVCVSRSLAPLHT